MSLTPEMMLFFFLLMPGFLASAIMNALVVRKSPDGIMLAVEALVFSFVIYVIWGVLSGHFLFTVDIPNRSILRTDVSPYTLAGVVGLSVVLPLGWCALLTHDVPFRLLGKIGVTRRTGRGSAWLDVFVEQQRCVIVNFKDGRRLFGWPEFYSDDAKEGMLYLSSPAWLDDDGQYTYLRMRGFLITDRESVDSIMITDIGYNNVEFEDDGEQSTPQVRASGEGKELSSYSETGGRKESSSHCSTDKAAAAAATPATKEDVN